MKKQHVLIVLMLLLISIVAASASALQINTNSVTIGDSNQDRVSNVSSSFFVKNDGNTTLNNINLNSAATGYNIRFSPATITSLAPNAEVKVTVYGDIPLNFNAVETDEGSSDYLKAKALKIGTITAAAGSATDSADLYMQAVNQLEFKRGTLECGDKSKRIKDGTDFDELKPDTSCVFLIEVENNFDDDDDNDDNTGDIDFDDAEVQIEVDDSDFDVDDDESVDPDPDDTDEASFDFEIEEEVDDGSYDLIIRLLGEDENGAWHGEIWEANLKVERLTHDLQIKNAVMNPESMDCKGGTLKVDAKVINLGKRNEDDVKILLEVPDLELSDEKKGLSLDEDDYTSVSFTLQIPEDVEEGVYIVNLKTYFDGIAPSNTKSFNLAIDACEEPEDTASDDDSADTAVTPTTPATQTVPTQPATPSARIRTSDNEGFTSSAAYLGLLGVLIAVILVIIIVLAIVLLKRPRK